MGIYVYKLSTRRKVNIDGKEVYLARYAYKPHWLAFESDKINNKFHFQTGCVAADAAFKRKNIRPQYWCHEADGNTGKPAVDNGTIIVYKVAPSSPATTYDDTSEYVGEFSAEGVS